MKLIDNLIADFRYEKGITQVELGDEIGVTKTCIHNWEHKVNGISPKMQIKLLEYFGVEREQLFKYDYSK